jgi:DNA topoisomerase-2
VIQGYRGNDLKKDLKLEKTFHTSNMHLFHPVSGIKKYDSVEQILVDFLEVRMKYYKSRKENLLDNMEKLKVVLDNKAKFVRMVVEGDLVVFKKKRAELEQELTQLKFIKIDDTYDYLLGIKTYQYTLEEITKLYAEAQKIVQELVDLRKTPVVEMYRTDLLNCNV